MSGYFFKGGRADHKARAFAYIRDRMPLRVTDCHRGEWAGFNWPTPPSRLVSSSQAVPTVLLSALGVVERFVDATGLKLVGYENRSNQVEPGLLVSVSVVGGVFMDRCELLQGMLVRSFAADPRYASLRLDLCSGGAGRSFCPQSSAAYCKMRLCVTLLGGGRYDVYDVRFDPSLECDGGASSLCVSVSPDAFCVGRIIADLVRCTQDGPNPKWLPSDCREGVG